MNQPAVILWNKCILMRGAWQPHGHSMCAHLLLPSPPPAWLLDAAQICFLTAKDATQGTRTHTAGSAPTSVLSCVAPCQVPVKRLSRCHLCLPDGMCQGSLLDAAHVIWAVGDPASVFPSSSAYLSPCGSWKAPSTTGQEKALQRE